MLNVAVAPGGRVTLAGFCSTAGSPPVTKLQLVPTRKSSMTPLGAVEFWHTITKPAMPLLLRLPVNEETAVAVSVGAGGALEPKVEIGGLIHRFTFVTPAVTS